MSDASHSKQSLSALTFAALGVVFGDIGTSPLYALKEAFSSTHHPIPATDVNILGILSLIVWTLLMIVTFKYVVIVLRADNHGEGGVVALMARVVDQARDRPRKMRLAILMGLIGAALFYGDGVITPAISVLSAVEGLEIVTPAFKPAVLPLTLVILVGLFVIQHRGTEHVGRYFGPIVTAWFLALSLVGIYNIVLHPQVLAALSPHYAVKFFVENPMQGYFALGAVILTVTGGEALYADMGHFGKKPIRIGWLAVVFPSLLLNYFGQGALLLRDPGAASNPFFLAIPSWGLIPMVILATAATVIASQALITGAFSMTRELVQLGFCPRLTIRHTSGAQMGQIYVPFINWSLLGLVLIVVVSFKTSNNLAAAYGIAVTLTMIVTSVLAFSVARRDWKWPTSLAVVIFLPMLVIELAFLGANLAKIPEGGWFPLAFGVVVMFLLMTWRQGRNQLSERLKADQIELLPFVSMLATETSMPRVPHTAVFLSPRYDSVPNALLHNLKHNFVLHEKSILVSVMFQPLPRVAEGQRVLVERVGHHFYRVKVFFGFMEEPDVPAALEWCEEQGLEIDPNSASYFLSREILLPTPGEGMALWRERVFEFMFRNASSAANFFKLPANRVVELGSRIVI
ncbi:potassium transporter Kup [Uliginosibacterium sp. H3]|uniref:Probable potassium transport system protein Kup n=1 Tax=Uliginosibacterium silvisoli TaxID=3114758 RepID=A0ABU6K3P9_9RHOO|nr:potassium transporter Kup [Uliginosibacterium sp. H3]